MPSLSAAALRARLSIADYPGSDMRVLREPGAADVAWAQDNPGTWRYFVDPTVDQSTASEVNITGGWQAESGGGIRKWLNPNFIPSSEFAGRDIVTEFELVSWRLDYGFNNIGHFIDAFSRTELIIVLTEDDPAGERGWPLRYGRDDKVGVDVYTSEARLPNDLNPWLRRKVSGLTILEEVCPQEGMSVLINPESTPFYELRGTAMLGWWDELRNSGTANDSGGE